MVPETPNKLCMTIRFCRKSFFCLHNWGNGPKIGFFEFEEKFGHQFSLNLFYIENLYLLCSCTNPIFGKNLVSEIEAEMLSANQIAGFLNGLFLLSKLMKQTHF